MKRFVMVVALLVMNGCEEREDWVGEKIEARFGGDRSGACVIAAVIAGGEVTKGWRCAGEREQVLDGVAMEIGSITKTMTGMLVGDGVSLDDELQKFAPVRVPEFGGEAIRVKHLVTHTSGLASIPEGLVVGGENPYAAVTEAELWRVLGEAELAVKPGTRWEYSNFAVMLLSSVIAGQSGESYEAVLKRKVLAPLGMGRSYLKERPEGVRVAVGHKVGGAVTSAWDFGENTGGVGGVKATMEDMIRYAKAQLGEGDARVVAMAKRSHERVAVGGEVEMGSGWVRAKLDGRVVLVHDGGTGGFSSILIVDPEGKKAVVVLADTAMATVGGVTELGLHLLDERLELGGPRLAAVASGALVDGLVGRYSLEGVEMKLEKRGEALWAVALGEELELAFDSHGDFYPRDNGVDALLTPVTGEDGAQTFVWVMDGVPVAAERQ